MRHRCYFCGQFMTGFDCFCRKWWLEAELTKHFTHAHRWKKDCPKGETMVGTIKLLKSVFK